MFQPIKQSGGPGIFMHRLQQYMQEHEMIKFVSKRPDIYLATPWVDNPPRRCKIVFRAASVYYDSSERRRKRFNQKIKDAIRKVDYVIYQSSFARTLCEKVLGRYYKYKVKAKRCAIIHNGFDTSTYVNVPAYKRDCQNLFVALSNWTKPIKRVGLIESAFVRANVEDSKLIVIGKLPTDMSKRGSERITRTGSVGIKDAVAYLKDKPIFVHLSYAETCPNCVVEALSFGCPVITNNIGATPEIVGEDGIVAKCDHQFEFKRRLVDLRIKRFRPIYKAFRDSARREWIVDRPDLSMKYCAKQYLKVFEDVLS